MCCRATILLLIAALLAGALSACQPAQIVPTPLPPTPTVPPIPTHIPTVTPEPTPRPAPTATPEPSPTPVASYGPTGFPPDVNPLTGLQVSDPAVLDRRPLLIKVSNFPAVVRPQNGLSFADHVWEHVMEGWRYTRLTAVFYGQTPESVGSVRSGRLPDLELVPMYQGLYDASGFSTNVHDPGTPPRMRELMLAADWFPRNFSADFGYGEPYNIRINIPGVAFEHTLFAVPAALWQLADQRGLNRRPALEPGLAFSPAVPEGGMPTAEVTIEFPADGPTNTWRYDPDSGAWLHWTDGAPHRDFLTGQQLAFENVVIVYAEHYEADFLEYGELYSVGAVMQGEGRAVLLRDGLRFDVTWRRTGITSMMQFYDAGGMVIAFKPGKTWFNLVPTNVFPPDITFVP